MRVQVASDIHLEFDGAREAMPPIERHAPVLALLGDIGYPHEQCYAEFLKDMADLFDHVLVVAGNHEYYNAASYEQANADIDRICGGRPNLHFLQRRALEVDVLPGVRLLGTTLWTAIPEGDIALEVQFRCNDYRKIALQEGDGTRTFRVPDQNRLHTEEVAWLESELQRARADGRRAVVLTHHAPLDRDCLEDMDPDDAMRFIEFTDLTRLFAPPVAAWAFGHTHRSCDQTVSGVRVVSNQLGYITHDEADPRYDPAFVLDLS